MRHRKKFKRLVFTVTNELNYDQRMIRICSSLQNAGFDVLLVGRKGAGSLPLQKRVFRQKRLALFFGKGKLFYIEYNIRLFLFLLFKEADLICAIDLDTILPCYFVSALKRKKRVYDAHELFCEMKEVVTRPSIHSIWQAIERFAVPRFQNGYTVNKPIRDIFEKRYGVRYEVIMNVPFDGEPGQSAPGPPFIIYQGAVNEGRSFETLIPAFQWINCPLHIYGKGNFFDTCKKLIHQYQLHDKVFLKGTRLPEELREITRRAVLGITLFENNGLNNYYSLGNRFFDYMQAGIPQLCVKYPAYEEINREFEVAYLIEDLSAPSIAKAVNRLLQDKAMRDRLRANSLQGRLVYNWQNEEKKLIRFYNETFAT